MKAPEIRPFWVDLPRNHVVKPRKMPRKTLHFIAPVAYDLIACKYLTQITVREPIVRVMQFKGISDSLSRLMNSVTHFHD